MHHLLTIRELNEIKIEHLLNRAQYYIDAGLHRQNSLNLLKEKTIANLFFEPSTRTRISFEVAAKRLGAQVINFANAQSSITKGETELDTFLNLQAMQIQCFIIRHATNGLHQHLATYAAPHITIINAGEGTCSHPSQALLDLLTIRQHKPHLSSLSVAIVGDIAHSRVAHSLVEIFKLMHIPDVRLVAPPLLQAKHLQGKTITHHHVLGQAIEGVDVIIMLRIQHERMQDSAKLSLPDYISAYQLNAQRLIKAKKDVIIMHPGPVNRGVELTDEVADGSQSLILRQVENGVAMRMAILSNYN